jgi:hypothetical protein
MPEQTEPYRKPGMDGLRSISPSLPATDARSPARVDSLRTRGRIGCSPSRAQHHDPAVSWEGHRPRSTASRSTHRYNARSTFRLHSRLCPRGLGRRLPPIRAVGVPAPRWHARSAAAVKLVGLLVIGLAVAAVAETAGGGYVDTFCWIAENVADRARHRLSAVGTLPNLNATAHGSAEIRHHPQSLSSSPIRRLSAGIISPAFRVPPRRCKESAS